MSRLYDVFVWCVRAQEWVLFASDMPQVGAESEAAWLEKVGRKAKIA